MKLVHIQVFSISTYVFSYLSPRMSVVYVPDFHPGVTERMYTYPYLLLYECPNQKSVTRFGQKLHYCGMDIKHYLMNIILLIFIKINWIFFMEISQ